MVPAVDDGAAHSELVPLGELHVAVGAREALYVVDELARPHDELGAADVLGAASTPPDAETPDG